MVSSKFAALSCVSAALAAVLAAALLLAFVATGHPSPAERAGGFEWGATTGPSSLTTSAPETP